MKKYIAQAIITTIFFLQPSMMLAMMEDYLIAELGSQNKSTHERKKFTSSGETKSHIELSFQESSKKEYLNHSTKPSKLKSIKTRGSDTKIEESQVTNLPTVKTYNYCGITCFDAVLGLLLNKFKPTQIACILDCDGTVTSSSFPVANHLLQPRGHMDFLVKELHERGVYITVSSAWTPFEETVNRLETLGLKELIGCKQSLKRIITSGSYSTKPVIESFKKSEDHEANAEIEVMQLGRIVSCRKVLNFDSDSPELREGIFKQNDIWYAPDPMGTGYRLKHLSLDHSFDIEDQSIKSVVFVDDSDLNIKIFQEGMVNAKWFKHVNEVHILDLTPLDGEVAQRDIIERFQDTKMLFVTPDINYDPLRVLPHKLLLQVLQYLHIADFGRLAQVCSPWKNFLKEKEMWEFIGTLHCKDYLYKEDLNENPQEKIIKIFLEGLKKK